MTIETPAAAAAPDAMAEPPPAEPVAAAEAAALEAAEVPEAAAPEVAAPEVAEVASTTTPPAQEEEPEVVLGRRLLPSPAEIPLPRLSVKCQQAQEELEAGIRCDSSCTCKLDICFVSVKYVLDSVKLCMFM
jgi:hypothetical protein